MHSSHQRCQSPSAVKTDLCAKAQGIRRTSGSPFWFWSPCQSEPTSDYSTATARRSAGNPWCQKPAHLLAVQQSLPEPLPAGLLSHVLLWVSQGAPYQGRQAALSSLRVSRCCVDFASMLQEINQCRVDPCIQVGITQKNYSLQMNAVFFQVFGRA